MPIEEQVLLNRYTSLRVGGPARYFVRAKNDADVYAGVLLARSKNLPYLPLGQGSNTLFPDEGFPGVIIHMEDRTMSVTGTAVTAASGVFMRQLINFSLEHNLRGLEELAGIPGTVGGAVRGNAGTWSTETKDHLHSVDILPAGKNNAVRRMNAADCGFSYRTSIFKTSPGSIILRATFSLVLGDRAEGEALVRTDLEQRRAKQPHEFPSAGSMFKNPDKEHGIYAGQLIESCGLKGYTIGGAGVSTKHANFIVNHSHATSHDIRSLISHVQMKVKEKYNILLEPEVHIVGK